MTMHAPTITRSSRTTTARDQASAQDHQPVRAAQRRVRRLRPRAIAFTALAAVALCLGTLAVVMPYSRGIIGDQDGSRIFVQTACDAPIVAVGANGARTVDAAGNWVTEPPCQRSAAFRLVLGGALLIFGGGLGYAGIKRSRTAPEPGHAVA